MKRSMTLVPAADPRASCPFYRIVRITNSVDYEVDALLAKLDVQDLLGDVQDLLGDGWTISFELDQRYLALRLR